tara:strand:+ start:101 stop:676 length:576 start_codon:yes stop_codon:yes gene_type:complete
MIIQNNKIKSALENLIKGNIIIYETDTLYGLGADATNTLAIEKINILKKRKTPLSIMIKSINDIHKYAYLSDSDLEIAKQILPGPFTILLNSKNANLSYLVQQDSNKIGIRIPKNKFCIELLNRFDKPIITTSVNIHGQRALNNIDEIENIFFNIPIYDSQNNKDSKGSTILDLTERPVKTIRQGDGIYNI